MPAIRQSSFAGGELAPLLWGQTDSALRARSLRKLRNAFITHHGAIMSRSGTVYVGQTKTLGDRCRLVEFIYSDAQSYVLEFGDHYVRFISAGEYLVYEDPGGWDPGVSYNVGDLVSVGVEVFRSLVAANLGNDPFGGPGKWEDAYNVGDPYEIVAPYLSGDLSTLKWAQSGDVMTFCCDGYPPWELARNGHTDWAFTLVDFDRPTFTTALWPAAINPLPTADATHPAREWSWQVTQLVRDAHGIVTESTPATVLYSRNSASPWAGTLLPSSVAVYPDMPVTIRVYEAGGLSEGTTVGYRIYRGRGGLYGWIGDVSDPLAFTTAGNEFTDVGQAPDYTRQPPKGTNPFKVYDYSSNPATLLRTEYPRCVAYYDGRRAFASTAERPARVWFSAVEDYANFDQHSFAISSDAAEYELACRRKEEIRSLVPVSKLLMPTNSSVWSLTGPGGGAIDPGSTVPPDVRAHVHVGCNTMDPLVVENAVLMAQQMGRNVRDLAYALQKESFSGGDVSANASHLFAHTSLVDWCYARVPFGIVWAVRDDGTMLSFTYNPERGINAWAVHEFGTSTTKAGIEVESICSVPEDTEDAVYVLVKRTVAGETRRYVERFASRILPVDANDEPRTEETIALDAAMTFRTITSPILTGLEHLEGLSVMALVDGEVAGPYTVTGGEIDLSAEYPDAADEVGIVHVGLAFTGEVEPLDISQEKEKQKRVDYVTIEVVDSRGLKVGEDADSLVDPGLRPPEGYGAVGAATEMIRLPIKSSTNTGGRIVIRQDDPLFFTIVGITREVSVER